MSSDIVGSLMRQNLRQTKNPQLYLDTTRKNRRIRVLSIAYVCLAGVVFLSTRCLRARRRASGTWRPRRARRTRLGTHPRCAHRSRRPLRARGRLLHGCRVCGRSHGRLHRHDAFHLGLDVSSSCWLSGTGRGGNGERCEGEMAILIYRKYFGTGQYREFYLDNNCTRELDCSVSVFYLCPPLQSHLCG
jgi:hypothetical protein